MRLKTRAGAVILLSTALIVIGALFALLRESRSEDKRSNGDLMAAMDISRTLMMSKARDFMLRDLNGKRVRLNDHRGKIVLINFWTTW